MPINVSNDKSRIIKKKTIPSTGIQIPDNNKCNPSLEKFMKNIKHLNIARYIFKSVYYVILLSPYESQIL